MIKGSVCYKRGEQYTQTMWMQIFSLSTIQCICVCVYVCALSPSDDVLGVSSDTAVHVCGQQYWWVSVCGHPEQFIPNTLGYIPPLSSSRLIRKAQAIPLVLPQDLANRLSYLFVPYKHQTGDIFVCIFLLLFWNPELFLRWPCSPPFTLSRLMSSPIQNWLSDILDSFPFLSGACVSLGRVFPVSRVSSLRGILSGREQDPLPPMVKLFWKLSEVK